MFKYVSKRLLLSFGMSSYFATFGLLVAAASAQAHTFRWLNDAIPVASTTSELIGVSSDGNFAMGYTQTAIGVTHPVKWQLSSSTADFLPNPTDANE